MRYAQYKDSGIEWIGEIPQGWELIRLKYCLIEIKENNFPIQSEQVLSLVKGKGVMPYEEKGNVGNVAKEDLSQYKLAYPNTLIVNSMNILIGSVGISNYYGCVSPAYYVFRQTTNMDISFINYIFTTRELQREFHKYAKGIMEIRLRVSAYDIFNRKIAIPSKKIQQQIANYLDKKCEKIDRVVEIQNNIIERLREYKQSVITECVTKGLDKSISLKDSGIEWIGKIPQGWEIYKIKYCVIFNPIYSENLKDGTLVSFAPMECLTNCCLKCQETAIENVSTTYTYFAENDVIMAKVTPCFENGNIAIATDLINKIGFGSSELYVFRAKNINNKFLLYFLQNTIFKDMATSAMYGTGGLKRLPSEFIKNYKLALPSSIEQQQIANYLDKKCAQIDKIIADKELMIEKLIEYKKSLIYECVTGKRKVV